jgi:hypothetical protein
MPSSPTRTNFRGYPLAVSVKINGTTYRCANDFSIQEQGGAVATTQLNLLLEGHDVPLEYQVVQVFFNTSLVFGGIITNVGSPTWNTGSESARFSISASSFEFLLGKRLVKKNFYIYSFTSWSDVVQWLFDNIIAEEGITLGSISTTTEVFDTKYEVANKGCLDVLNEIASAIGNATWRISADRKFYFLISDDFSVVTPPEHITGLKVDGAIGDMRTVENLTGASSGVNAVETNESLKAIIAARSGGSGKIEVAETDSSIHSDVKAASQAIARLGYYNEPEKTLSLVCHDLGASVLFKSWSFDQTIEGVTLSGEFVVVNRTMTNFLDEEMRIQCTLKNRNYYSRIGYTARKAALLAKSATTSVADIYADNILTPDEKKTALADWLAAVDEKSAIDAEAAVYGISVSDYDSAFSSLANYLNGGSVWSSGRPLWISEDYMTVSTEIVGDDWRATWAAYNAAAMSAEKGLRNIASITMAASAQGVTRDRNETLNPATISADAEYASGSPYAGRFKISVITEAVTSWVDVYTSPSDVSSLSYTIPAKSSGSYVVAIRISLYAAGGTTTKLREALVTVSASISTAPVYLGPLSSEPSTGVVVNDYYFDTNLPGVLNGGNIVYFTGSVWAIATSTWAYYDEAIKMAFDDALAWGNATGVIKSYVSVALTEIANSAYFKNAFISSLSTTTQFSTAFCNDGATRRMTIDWDQAMLTARSDDKNNYLQMAENFFRSVFNGFATELFENGLVWRDSVLNETARLFYLDGKLQLRKGGVSMPLSSGECAMGDKRGLRLSSDASGNLTLSPGSVHVANRRGVGATFTKNRAVPLPTTATGYPAVGSWGFLGARLSGSTQSAAVQQTTVATPLMSEVMMPDGVHHRVSFRTGDTNIIYEVEDITSGALIVTGGPSTAFIPKKMKMIVTSDGRLVLMIINQANQLQFYIRAPNSDSTAWSSPTILSALGSDILNFGFAQGAGGHFIVIYSSTSHGDALPLVTRSLDLVSWESSYTVGQYAMKSAFNMELAVNSNGYLYAFASRSVNSIPCYMISQDDGQTFASNSTLDTSLGEVLCVSLDEYNNVSAFYFLGELGKYYRRSIGSNAGPGLESIAGYCACLRTDGALNVYYNSSGISLIELSPGGLTWFAATGTQYQRPTNNLDLLSNPTTLGANFSKLYYNGFYAQDATGNWYRILGAGYRKSTTSWLLINMGSGSAESGWFQSSSFSVACSYTRDGNGEQRLYWDSVGNISPAQQFSQQQSNNNYGQWSLAFFNAAGLQAALPYTNIVGGSASGDVSGAYTETFRLYSTSGTPVTVEVDIVVAAGTAPGYKDMNLSWMLITSYSVD